MRCWVPRANLSWPAKPTPCRVQERVLERPSAIHDGPAYGLTLATGSLFEYNRHDESEPSIDTTNQRWLCMNRAPFDFNARLG